MAGNIQAYVHRVREMDNFIKTYPGALSAERCEYFIDFFEKEDSLGHTHIGQSGSGVNQKRKNRHMFKR